MERTYQAPTMKEAYEMVKRDLGPEAVILQTRTMRKGGLLGFGGKEYIEVVASTDSSLAKRRVRPRQRQANRTPASGAGRKLLQEMYNNGSVGARENVTASTAVKESNASSESYRRLDQSLGSLATGAGNNSSSNENKHPLEALLENKSNSAQSKTNQAKTYPEGEALKKRGLDAIARVSEESGVMLDLSSALKESASTAQEHQAEPSTPGDQEENISHAQGVETFEHHSGQLDHSTVRSRDVSQAYQDQDLSREITEIRAMVRNLMSRQSDAPMAELPEHLFSEYLALLEQEVSEEMAEQIVHAVRDHLNGEEIESEVCVRREIRRVIESFVPSDDLEPSIRRMEGRPYTLALVGPTGVGKTTTLAKLAAKFKLKNQMSVAMITIDTYRIAAVDQLRTYAQIIGVPVHVVLTPDEMRQALRKCAHHDIVLIDTAGRSQRDTDKLEELNGFIDAARPDHVSLVLSSTCSQRVMMDAVERFSRVRSDSVIFTKLDEAVNFGVVFNTIRKVRKKLSYVTTGQEVPNDIQVADGSRIAELIVGGRE